MKFPNKINMILEKWTQDSRTHPYLFLVLIQGAGVGVSRSPWGLDPSFNWSVNWIIGESIFGKSPIIGPYGPLSFLDFSFFDSTLLFFLAQTFRIIVSLVLFKNLQSIIGRRISFNVSAITSIAIVTLLTSLNPPSSLASLALFTQLIADRTKTTPRYFFGIGALGSALFYVKPLALALFLAATLPLIMKSFKLSRKHCLRLFMSYLFGFIIVLVSVFKWQNFTKESYLFWLKGYWETLIGYSSMSIESVDRLPEYPIMALLTLYLIWIYLRTNLEKTWSMSIGLGLIVFASFKYGFNRHDAHSVLTFSVILTLIIIFSAISPSNRYLRKEMPIFISAAMVFVASGISLYNYADITYRINGFYDAIKIAIPHVKSNYEQQSKKDLQGIYSINEEMRNEIGQEPVAVMPYPETIYTAWGFNWAALPTPQLFSAYTPWLDNTNSNKVKSRQIRYFLVNSPRPVDNRNPWWDSPLTQIELLCNYQALMHDENWLLLEARTRSICDDNSEFITGGAIESYRKANENALIVADIEIERNIVRETVGLLWKKLPSAKLKSGERDYRLVETNSNNLLIYVPEQINWPYKWRIQSESIDNVNLNHEIIFRARSIKVN